MDADTTPETPEEAAARVAAEAQAAASADSSATSDSEALPEADGVPAAPADRAHVIEHRSFAREDADAPMRTTVITTRDSLASKEA